MIKVYVDDRIVGKFIANKVVPPNVRHIVVSASDEEEELERSSFDQEVKTDQIIIQGFLQFLCNGLD